MSAQIYNRQYIEAWLRTINSQNELVLFIVSLDKDDAISINTVNDLPEEKIAGYLFEMAEAIKRKQKTILLPFNKEGLQ